MEVRYFPRRVVVDLELPESKALITMARHDMRWARDQVRYLIVEEAKRRGLWPDSAEGEAIAEVEREAA